MTWHSLTGPVPTLDTIVATDDGCIIAMVSNSFTALFVAALEMQTALQAYADAQALMLACNRDRSIGKAVSPQTLQQSVDAESAAIERMAAALRKSKGRA